MTITCLTYEVTRFDSELNYKINEYFLDIKLSSLICYLVDYSKQKN